MDTMQLDTDDKFPRLVVDLLDDGAFELPRDTAGAWTVVLAYRGHW
jgi:hypothetical protein